MENDIYSCGKDVRSSILSAFSSGMRGYSFMVAGVEYRFFSSFSCRFLLRRRVAVPGRRRCVAMGRQRAIWVSSGSP